LNIQQEIEELTLSYFKTINSEIIEENGLYKISIPEKFQNYFRKKQILLTFDEKIALEHNCELIIPGNKILFQIISNCTKQGPITLKQTRTHTNNIAVRYHFFVHLFGMHNSSKLFSITIDLKTMNKISIDEELENTDFSMNDFEIAENTTKSYKIAIEMLEWESQNMREKFLERSNNSFEGDFELFSSRYDAGIRELDDAINEKEEKSNDDENIKKFRFENIKKIKNLENEKNSLIQNIQNKHEITLDYELIATEIIKF
jgi:hypothetical protein